MLYVSENLPDTFGGIDHKLHHLYEMIVPKYISNFRMVEHNVAPGFNKFCLNYPSIVERYGIDGLYGIVWNYCYPYWWFIARRHRVLKREHTEEEWEEKKIAYDNKCAYCGTNEVKLTKDHVIPVVKQGRDTIDNIVPCCKSCNSKKNKKDVADFSVCLSKE